MKPSEKYSFYILADFTKKYKGLQRKIFARKIRELLLAQRFSFCRGIYKFPTASKRGYNALAGTENHAAILFCPTVLTPRTARGNILAKQTFLEHKDLCSQSGFDNKIIIRYFAGFVKSFLVCIHTKMLRP